MDGFQELVQEVARFTMESAQDPLDFGKKCRKQGALSTLLRVLHKRDPGMERSLLRQWAKNLVRQSVLDNITAALSEVDEM